MSSPYSDIQNEKKENHRITGAPYSTSFDLKSYFKECQSLINKSLEALLPRKEIFPAKIHEAMHYSLFAGGKRVRPILCMAASEACGGERNTVIPIACALEMIHTFSLIHDDLPAMDNDNWRRGVLTSHKMFGEALAILAGDALVSQAFILLGQLGKTDNNPRRVLEIIHDIANATGSLGMVGGQVLDLDAEGHEIDLSSLKRLHELKTGRLITVSVTSGAKMATSSVSKISALACYGEAIGLAFQIADDILDIEGGADLGKDIGSDKQKKKATYPSHLGLARAKEEALICKEEALTSLKDFGPEADPLRALASYIIERTK